MHDFKFYLNDQSYDMNDNPYGKVVFHRYTNMADMNDTTGYTEGFTDEEIPLKLCQGKDQAWSGTGIKYYCPDFNETHFIHGGFWTDKYSWLRIALHLCENTTEA